MAWWKGPRYPETSEAFRALDTGLLSVVGLLEYDSAPTAYRQLQSVLYHNSLARSPDNPKSARQCRVISSARPLVT